MMSLDVYLIEKNQKKNNSRQAIFIRENGQNKEINREEWDKRFPNKEPVTCIINDNNEVFCKNITHNLTQMADAAGIYKYLWRPEELNISKAKQLIEPLELGLHKLKSLPNYFKTFNPSNGWGDYEVLIDFVENYLQACKKHPKAKIEVSR